MLRPRVMPCLLLGDGGLVKTTRFKKPVYVGDPINAVKIFNDKQAGELILLDIRATPQGRGPRIDTITEIVSECFMPVVYGGGVTTLDQLNRVLRAGVEKVAINTQAVRDPSFVRRAAERFGSSTIVVSLDVKRPLLGGARLATHGGRRRTSHDPVAFVRRVEELGAGEILINSVDRDGTMTGYDLDLVRRLAGAVGIPVIACGGAGSLDDMVAVVKTAGAAAAAAGSLFVFHGRHRAVLITFPSEAKLERAFQT